MKRSRLNNILEEKDHNLEVFKKDGWQYFMEAMPDLKIEEDVKKEAEPKVEAKAEPKPKVEEEPKEEEFKHAAHKKAPSKASIFKNHR